ncbi:MAG: hypothetical protein DRH30_03245 [Deltaproteobacteria bacterium]|nr:MAG: hypothetical protein DRH30_03245 [Deltaproteobacteria bacterium]
MSGTRVDVECETCGFAWRYQHGEKAFIMGGQTSRFYCSRRCLEARHDRPVYDGALPFKSKFMDDGEHFMSGGGDAPQRI